MTGFISYLSPVFAVNNCQ